MGWSLPEQTISAARLLTTWRQGFPGPKLSSVAGTTQVDLPIQALRTTAMEVLALPIRPVLEQIPSPKPREQLPTVVPNEAN